MRRVFQSSTHRCIGGSISKTFGLYSRPSARFPATTSQLAPAVNTRLFTLSCQPLRLQQPQQPLHSQQPQQSATMTNSAQNAGPLPYSALEGKIHPKLLKATEVMNYDLMTPVQQRVLTELPNLRSDLLVQAKTGTGKTVAFLLPALHNLLKGDVPAPRGKVAILILTPTRELALQIKTACDQLTSQLAKPLECHFAVGGTSRNSAHSKFMAGNPSVLVATPGRLNDYLSDADTAEKLSDIQTLILDEADTMLNTGFYESVKQILHSLPPKLSGWQGMCFSATMPPRVKEVVDLVLNRNYTTISTVDENESPTHERVPQFSVIIPGVEHTFTALYALLQHETTPQSKVIVFGCTARMVAVFAALASAGLTPLKSFEIHSRLSQNARTRAANEFRDAKSGILFASDVVGRGLDFPDVDLVLQVGFPSSGEQYVHRVGRTARAGKDGRAVILLTQDESVFMRNNRQLPIKPHPSEESINKQALASADLVHELFYKVDEDTKARAYMAYIGFLAGGGLAKTMRLEKVDLVRLGNALAVKGMGCPEPPIVDKMMVGKAGLKGIPGFNYGTKEEQLERQLLQKKARAARGQQKPKSEQKPKSGQKREGENAGGKEKNSRNKRR
ncbi:DEAD box ATP-dependent RNA helicase [Aspergillus karnatakaensis]|uniref:DEAD/DEAH box helicase n=1 Tax=Aspergillus karnatakaensis TaxID=1810916 RepID=UPI003CCE2683